MPVFARWKPLLRGMTSLGTLWLMGWMLHRLLAQPSAETALFAAMLVVTVAVGICDQLLNALLLPELWRQRFHVTHLAVPLVFLAFVVNLVLRVVRGVRAANENLEARVQAAGTQTAAASERKRFYRDQHDNQGARLLSLVYSARASRTRCRCWAPPRAVPRRCVASST